MLPSLISSCVSLDKQYKNFGLQLYSLRDIIKKDVQGTMKQVADIGYKKIEAYDYKDQKIFDIPYGDFIKMCNDLDIKITSGHYSTGFNATTSGNLRNGWEQAVSDAKEAGQEYMVVPYMDKDERQTIDDYKKICELLNKGGEVCKQNGIRLAYHNHEFEFQKIDDQIPFDVMMAELDPKLVAIELDIYWIVYAGYNPVDYFSKYPSRFELWHVKDMEKDNRELNANVGTGSIDFVQLFGHAEHAGLKHAFIEQEDYPVSPMESIKVSHDNLKKMLG